MEPFDFTTSDGTILKAAISEPSRPAKGTIQFQIGFAADFQDYASVISPLSESYKIVSFNPRDHGGSQGTFTFDSWISDSGEIFKRYCDNRSAVIAHSFGTVALKETEPESWVFLNPALSTRFFDAKTAKGMHIANKYGDSGVVRSIDAALAKLPEHAPFGHLSHPLRSVGALDGADVIKHIQQPLLYFSSHDAMVKREKDLYRNILYNMSPTSQDASDLVQDLNHCFNYHGLHPFLKEEKGKKREKIVQRIADFLEKTL